MSTDLVIDTNIFMHAHDPRQECQQDCLDFLQNLLEGSVMLCVDDGFDTEEAKNCSKIQSEYLNFIISGSYSFYVLQILALSQRIKICPKSVSPQDNKVIRSHVIDSTDRIFVKVAANSREKIFISHDDAAISAEARDVLKSKIGVRVCRASTGKQLL
jgi:hypothetical protein